MVGLFELSMRRSQKKITVDQYYVSDEPFMVLRSTDLTYHKTYLV